jgi:hypothetical protein
MSTIILFSFYYHFIIIRFSHYSRQTPRVATERKGHQNSNLWWRIPSNFMSPTIFGRRDTKLLTLKSFMFIFDVSETVILRSLKTTYHIPHPISYIQYLRQSGRHLILSDGVDKDIISFCTFWTISRMWTQTILNISHSTFKHTISRMPLKDLIAFLFIVTLMK